MTKFKAKRSHTYMQLFLYKYRMTEYYEYNCKANMVQ